MPDKPATVFVVDDDVSVREALEALVREAGHQVASFATADDFLAHPRATGPSCLILDIGLPDVNGLDLQSRIARERRDMPIIFITGYGDVPSTVRAMKGGAIEFLTKPFSEVTLFDAIEAAIERSLAELEEQAAQRALAERHALLTPREAEIMSLIVTGLMNKQVGGRLGISEITVKAHRGRVMEKMQARSFAELVKMSQRLQVPSSRP